MQHEFEIPQHRVSLVEKWLAKATKKLKAYPGQVFVEWGEVRGELITTPYGSYYENYVEGTLHFPDLKLGHHIVVAKAEKMEGGNLLSGKDEITLARFQHGDLQCEHCNTNRRRKKFIILQDERDGGLMSVGTSCVQEYTGYDPKEALAALNMWASIQEELGMDPDWGCDGAAITVNVVDIIAATVAYAQAYGFVSSKAARESESFTSASWMTIQHIMIGKGEKPELTITDSDRQMAQTIFDQWLAIPERGCSEFDFKKRLMAVEGAVETKHYALICGAANYDYTQLTKVEVADSTQEFFGSDERETHTLTVTEATVKRGTYYSDYILVKGVNQDGHEWIYMGNSKFAQSVEPGETYQVKAAVKHDESQRWGKSNKLDRPTLARRTAKAA